MRNFIRRKEKLFRMPYVYENFQAEIFLRCSWFYHVFMQSHTHLCNVIHVAIILWHTFHQSGEFKMGHIKRISIGSKLWKTTLKKKVLLAEINQTDLRNKQNGNLSIFINERLISSSELMKIILIVKTPERFRRRKCRYFSLWIDRSWEILLLRKHYCLLWIGNVCFHKKLANVCNAKLNWAGSLWVECSPIEERWGASSQRELADVLVFQ